MSLSLPHDKLTCTLALVLSWRSRQAATKRELQSLIGHLNHAAIIVLPGRTFLRRMIDLMKTTNLPRHHVRLTAEFKSDLHWWVSFLPRWNGRSIVPQEDPSHEVTSDASGGWGCGAVTNTGQWFQVQWPESWSEINIAVKEMVPVVISVAIWGAKSLLSVRTDNMAVVHPHSRDSQRPAADAPAALPAFFHSHHQIGIRARHAPGVLNTAADA